MATQGQSGSASEGQLEEKIDFAKETDETLKNVESLVSAGALQDALQLLYALEKRCRTGNDNKNLARVCKAAVESCKTAGDHEAMLNTLTTLSTRRNQKMSAITALVETAMPWCVVSETYAPITTQSAEEAAIRDKLVANLRTITDGKLFLEREHAILTRALATIKEQEGSVGAAAEVLQEVHVETYGSLSKKEKVEFILEQLRLTLAKQDYVRAAIVSGKINRKHLPEMPAYKIRFFELLTILHRHDTNALELVKDYHAIYQTQLSVSEEDKDENQDPIIWMESLQNAVLFLALSPFGNEQQDLLHRVSEDPNLDKLPACKSTIQLLLKKEIVNYPLPHQKELESLAAFQEAGLAQHWGEIFHRRVIQHNIRTVSLYYKRIHGARLAQLLQLSADRLESEIASMVSDGTVYAKIDRPADIVRFEKPKSSEAILSDWSGDIEKLLHLIETTTHLIHKEQMTAQ